MRLHPITPRAFRRNSWPRTPPGHVAREFPVQGAFSKLIAGICGKPKGVGRAPPVPAMSSAFSRVDGLAIRLQRLAEAAADFWMRCGPDEQFGGFHGTLDVNGRPMPPDTKSVIQQSRHLWAMSTWYRHGAACPRARALADDLYQLLMNRFYDENCHEFAFSVSRDGNVVDESKVLYAQAFAIYGLSEYARCFDVSEAAGTAIAVFHAIDDRAHDSRFGGYDQRDDAPWMAKGSQKETNTHIHLLEAYTTLFEVTADARVGCRLRELADVITSKIIQPAGYAHKDFTLNWTPVGPATVSYGHDIETFWLLGETARALGNADAPSIMNAAEVLARNSAEWGFDGEQGGYFEEGPLGGMPNRREKVWWVQAEAIAGLFRLFQRTGEERYLDRLEATLRFVETRQLNAAAGEWFWGLLEDATLGPKGPTMGEAWKTGYHTLRALTYTQRWMRDWQKTTASDQGADGPPPVASDLSG